MIINEVRPHSSVGVANWRALQSAVKQKSAATLQHSDTTKTYSEQQTIKLYRWAKLHLDRNEQHAVFDKLASAEKIAQLLPNLPLREVAASKTKYSRNEDGMKNWVELQRAVRHSSSNPIDPRHTARLSVGDQQAVLSKSDAERLFRWLKSKFRTKKERDLFEFLGSTQLLDALKTSLTEKWSAKYKRSIDCSNPKGFSQRAHCAGRKKHNNKGGLKDVVSENTDNYGDEEIERYGTELIQRQRNLDFLRSVFGYNNLHRVARALRAGNLKQRLSPAEGDSEYRSRYRRAVRILDAMTDEVGNIIPHSEDARYPKLK